MEDGDDEDIDDEQFMKMMGGMGSMGMGNQGPGQVPTEDEMKQAELLMQNLFGAMGGASGQGQATADD